MSELVRKKEIAVKVIRSHLISCPIGLTVQQLERAYEESENKKLPFRLFGFTDSLSFLKSLGDVVRISYNNGRPTLFGIADESSKHVKALVDNQRIRLKGKRAQECNKVRRLPSTNSSMWRKYTRNHVSAYLQQNILKVVRMLKASASLPLFLEIYEKEIGMPLIAERHGFRSLAELLKSIPDICSLEFGRKDRTGNVLYVSPVKISPKSYRCPDVMKNQEKQCTVTNSTSRLSDAVATSSNSTPRPQEMLREGAVSRKATDLKETPDIRNNFANHVDSSLPAQTEKEDKNFMDLHVTPSCELMKSEVIELLKSYPKGVRASSISSLYEKKFNKTFDILKLGYFSIIEFISTLTDEVSLCRLDPKGDWHVTLRSSEHIVKETREKMLLNEDIEITKMEIREILLKSNGAVPLEKIGSNYERAYRHKMDFADYDADALTVVLLQIEGLVIYREKRKLMVTMNKPDKSIGRCSMCNSGNSKVPIDAVGPLATYKLPNLPEVGDQYIDVFVADVISPDYFTIQIHGKKTTKALNDLMDELDNFYNSPEAELYKLPDSMMNPGQVCAAVYYEDQNWHRAVITRFFDTEFVELLYVDYGSIGAVPKSSLKLLKTSFLNLPLQMIRARLSHIKPRDLRNWTVEARNTMLDMCRDKQLLALVRGIENRVLSLCLCDTTDPDVDVHVNDALVDKKHAVYFPDGLKEEQECRLKELYMKNLEAEKAGQVVDWDNIALDLLQPDGNGNAEPVIPGEVTTMHQNNSTEFHRATVINDVDVAGSARVSDDISGYVSSPEASSREWLVQKRVIANGQHILYIINFQGNPMVTSFQISMLLGQSSDFLRPLLLMQNLKFPELVVGHNDKNKDLFNAVYENKVPGAVSKGVLNDVMCLYRLQDVPSILRKLCHDNEDRLITDVLEILDDFENNATFWLCDDNVEADYNDYVEELEKEHERLNKARKNLLIKLANESSSSTVDAIKAIEVKIFEVMAKIENAKPKQVASRDTNTQVLGEAVHNQYSVINDRRRVDYGAASNTDFVLPKNIRYEGSANISEATPDASCVETKPSNDFTAILKDRREEVTSSDDFADIPGAHADHDIVEFMPQIADPASCVPPDSTGASGALLDNRDKVSTTSMKRDTLIEVTHQRNANSLGQPVPPLQESCSHGSGNSPVILQNSFVEPKSPHQQGQHFLHQGNSVIQVPSIPGNHVPFPTQAIQTVPPPGFSYGMPNHHKQLNSPAMIPFDSRSTAPLFQTAGGQIYLNQIGASAQPVPLTTYFVPM